MHCSVKRLGLQRALRDLERLQDSCVSGVLKTPGLESHYRWVGLLARTSVSLVARADDGRDFDAAGALEHMRLGAVRNTAAAR